MAQFLVEEKNRLGDEETFWKTYVGEDGKRMGYQDILSLLKTMRLMNNRRDAIAAHHYFKGNLYCIEADEVFTYLKAGKRVEVKKIANVAEIWRSLLKANLTVRDRVERGLQMEGPGTTREVE